MYFGAYILPLFSKNKNVNDFRSCCNAFIATQVFKSRKQILAYVYMQSIISFPMFLRNSRAGNTGRPGTVMIMEALTVKAFNDPWLLSEALVHKCYSSVCPIQHYEFNICINEFSIFVQTIRITTNSPNVFVFLLSTGKCNT